MARRRAVDGKDRPLGASCYDQARLFGIVPRLSWPRFLYAAVLAFGRPPQQIRSCSSGLEVGHGASGSGGTGPSGGTATTTSVILPRYTITNLFSSMNAR